MKFGFSDKQLKEIKNIFASYEEIEEAILFGSRAIDTFKEASDVDIAIKGKKVNSLLTAKLKDHFAEETYLPFCFDIVAFNTISSEELKKHINTKGKVIYRKSKSEWKDVMLQDVVSILGDGLHGTPKYDDNGEYYFINGNNLCNGKIVFKENTGRTIEEEYEKYKKDLNDRTILVSINGTLGNVALYNNEKCFLGKSACYFNVLAEVDKLFIKYVITDKNFQEYIINFANGTTIKNVSLKTMREYPFLLPPLPEQKAIAGVLSSLDDKIDLLHRQNKTLEAMAETLFRQWFVEEAQEDWEEKQLSFFGEIICGKTPSKKIHSYFNGKIPFIKIPDMHGNIFLFETADSLTEEGKQSQANKTLPPKSICVSCIATVGLVSINAKESQTNQQINSIIPQKDYYRYFLYLTMKSYYDLLHSMASGGTATLNLNTGNFSKIPVQYPGDNVLVAFQREVEPCFDKIFINQIQICTLEKLRDTLLPKLINGEVRVAV